jgi:hypothetical protein
VTVTAIGSCHHVNKSSVSSRWRSATKVVETIEELDASGGAPLAKRQGLLRAVQLVEAGHATPRSNATRSTLERGEVGRLSGRPLR